MAEVPAASPSIPSVKLAPFDTADNKNYNWNKTAAHFHNLHLSQQLCIIKFIILEKGL
jgi:hypothetical protein